MAFFGAPRGEKRTMFAWKPGTGDGDGVAIGFTSDAGMMFNVIKPASTADFEMVLGRLREALQKSENPARKQQAASWKIYKSTDPSPEASPMQVNPFPFTTLRNFLERQIAKTRGELEKSERQLVAYAQAQGIINTGSGEAGATSTDANSIQGESLIALNKALADAIARRVAA